jgi:putative NADPH-quinone reductase
MRIVLIQGHPDHGREHFCHALADAYARGAEAAGHAVERLDVADIAPEPLASEAEFGTEPGGAMAEAREAIRAADHIVVVFPLWLGTMPARLKAFFEQMARAGFALGQSGGGWPEQHLKGKSAHVIVTMGMPGLAYRVWFLNSGVAVLKRMILGMSGVRPIRQTTIGGIEAMDDAARGRWLARIEAAGRAGR